MSYLTLEHREPPTHLPPHMPAEGFDEIAAELDALPACQKLRESQGLVAYFASAAQIPKSLWELGRLRELAHRAEGQSCGSPIDLDDYDQHYTHIILWDAVGKAIVGGLRFANAAQALALRGRMGLHLATAFQLAPQLCAGLSPALEVGRSFIRSDCPGQRQRQRQIDPLSLWHALGAYLAWGGASRHVLVGTVGLGSNYQPSSQRLIASYLKRCHSRPDLARQVQPHHPAAIDESLSREIADLRALDTAVSILEGGRAGIPNMLKRYLQLGAEFLGFAHDPQFPDRLLFLMWIDLRRTPIKRLAVFGGLTLAATIHARKTQDLHLRQRVTALAG